MLWLVRTFRVTNRRRSCSCSCSGSRSRSRWCSWSWRWRAATWSRPTRWGTCTSCNCRPRTWPASSPWKTLSRPPAQIPWSPSGPDRGGRPCSAAPPRRRRTGWGWCVPAPRPRPPSPGSSRGRTWGCGAGAWPPRTCGGWRWCCSRCTWPGTASRPCLVLMMGKRRERVSGRRVGRQSGAWEWGLKEEEGGGGNKLAVIPTVLYTGAL